jgi:hypothetical protein
MKGLQAQAARQAAHQTGVEPGELIIAVQDVDAVAKGDPGQAATETNQPRRTGLDHISGRWRPQLGEQAEVVAEADDGVIDQPFGGTD